MTELPFIDEHRVLVPAPAPSVWRSLVAEIPEFANAGALARLLATEPRRASGGPLRAGSTLPGFEVADLVPGERLRLTGRHRFSRYALTFSLTPRPEGTLLSARTHAEFPGLLGQAYRRLVIGSGGHGVLVARLLRTVRRHAEAPRIRTRAGSTRRGPAPGRRRG